MAYIFESDPDKAQKNSFKHGVTFDEAKTAFDDPHADLLADTSHSTAEDRYILIGYSAMNRLLTVCYTERGLNVVRIISARKATTVERMRHERFH